MKQFLTTCCLFLFFSVSMPAWSQGVNIPISAQTEVVSGKTFFIHTVQQGQTLYSIAKTYQVEMKDIVRENKNQELKTGEILKIPANKALLKKAAHNQPEVKQPEKTIVYVDHTVQSKETVFGISKQYGITQEQLLNANPDVEQSGLKIGSVIRIPTNQEVSQTHTNTPTAQPLVVTKTVITPVSDADMKDKDEMVEKKEEAMVKPTKTKYGKKDSIDVALILPLFLNNLSQVSTTENNNATMKCFAFLPIYEGALLAMQKHANTSNVRLHIYDVTEDSESMVKLLNSNEFKSTDIMIGPLFIKPFQKAAEYALDKEIPIINIFSEKEEIITSNPYVIKLKPSIEYQYQTLANYIEQHHPDNKVFIVFYDSVSSGKNKIHLLTKVLNSSYEFINVSKTGYTKATQTIKNTKNAVVINFLDKENQVTLFVSNMSAIDARPDAFFAKSTWLNFDKLEPEYLQNINMHYYGDYFVDYQDPKVKSFVMEYYRNFQGDPVENAFIGYDLMDYLLHLLEKNPSDFWDNIEHENYPALHTSFQFKKGKGRDGYMNKDVNIFKISNYQLRLAN